VSQTNHSGRLFQDYRFAVTHLQGCAVEELIGVIADEDDLQPAHILLKPVDRPWQKFFLDVGIGIWEQWPDLDIADFCADDGYRYVDYAERFEVRIDYSSCSCCFCRSTSGFIRTDEGRFLAEDAQDAETSLHRFQAQSGDPPEQT
jgi:hypothetical protein